VLFRWKLKHHAAEAGGVGGRNCGAQARWKLKHHAAEAGGVGGKNCGAPARWKLKHHAAEAGGLGEEGDQAQTKGPRIGRIRRSFSRRRIRAIDLGP